LDPLATSHRVPVKAKAKARRLLGDAGEPYRDNGVFEFEDIPHVVRCVMEQRIAGHRIAGRSRWRA
jgi:hypothetical protein